MNTPILKRDDDIGMDEAFARDPYLAATMRYLVRRYDIQTVIETGTWRGYTARNFSEFVRRVHTIEIDPGLATMAKETLCDRKNVVIHEGDSAVLLPDIAYATAGPKLYFLDAHWKDEWPLFKELEAIAEAKEIEPVVIVIHDCKVPYKDFGYDTYKGQDLTFELVYPWLARLPFAWSHSFNLEAKGHKRGVLFVQPL